MAEGMDMAYTGDSLRAGGAGAGQASATAARAAAALRPVRCEMAMFGVVASATELAAAVLRARDAHLGVTEQTEAVNDDVSGRAQQVAGMGDGLTAQTAALAAQGGPR